MTRRGRYDGSRGGKGGQGSGYWMQIDKRRHLREQQYAYADHPIHEMIICPVCEKGFKDGMWYVYVIPTGDCVHMGCITAYPRSIWKEGRKEVKPQMSKEDQYFLDAAVEEVVTEGREVSEVSEEFDIDEERLRKAIEEASK